MGVGQDLLLSSHPQQQQLAGLHFKETESLSAENAGEHERSILHGYVLRVTQRIFACRERLESLSPPEEYNSSKSRCAPPIPEPQLRG